MAAVVMNTKNFEAGIRKIQANVSRQLPQAIMQGGRELQTITYPDVPVEKGALRSTSQVVVTAGRMDHCQGMVRYSANAPHNFFNYARKQHDEDLNHPRGGKDHYLSDNVDNASQLIINMMNRQIRIVL